jgi:HK97 family phage prohead protease
MNSEELKPRLITLADGREGLRGGLQVNVCQPADAASTPTAGSDPVLDFIASDETVDRYGEIISASGWQLDNYRRNPVFQNAHQYGDILFTLGRAVTTELRSQGGRPSLCQRIQFATQANPMARIAYELYRGGFLNAVSVGFIPRRWENGATDSGYARKYLEQELIEVSAVGIPANPNALQMGFRSGAVAKADLQELFELLRLLVETKVGHSARTDGPEGLAAGSSELLSLARVVRQTLRGV